MQLIREYVELSPVNIITEANDTGSKDLYISGIFAEAELKNRNGRIYPKDVMESAVAKYNRDYVSPKRAISELEHPEGRCTVKPALASHLITELKMDGTTVYGKAKVLNTPQGNILRGLLEGGVQMGVSTRALGSLKESNGTKYVQNDFQLFAIDAVSDPSSINAWVNAVNESKEWLVTDNGEILERLKAQVNKGKLTESKKLEMFTRFLSEISTLR